MNQNFMAWNLITFSLACIPLLLATPVFGQDMSWDRWAIQEELEGVVWVRINLFFSASVVQCCLILLAF